LTPKTIDQEDDTSEGYRFIYQELNDYGLKVHRLFYNDWKLFQSKIYTIHIPVIPACFWAGLNLPGADLVPIEALGNDDYFLSLCASLKSA